LKLGKDDQSAIINFQSATIECEKPNEFLYTFNGSLMVNKDIVAIDKDQILLRGSSLKNTKWIYGIALYTGHDSKIMMNSA
jgi:magnesium-transporting ATPase (P-type)